MRDLIRRDKERAEQEALDRLKAELTRAFATPDTSYKPLTGADSSLAAVPEQMAIRVQEAASLRLDDMYRDTRDRWGEA